MIQLFRSSITKITASNLSAFQHGDIRAQIMKVFAAEETQATSPLALKQRLKPIKCCSLRLEARNNPVFSKVNEHA